MNNRIKILCLIFFIIAVGITVKVVTAQTNKSLYRQQNGVIFWFQNNKYYGIPLQEYIDTQKNAGILGWSAWTQVQHNNFVNYRIFINPNDGSSNGLLLRLYGTSEVYLVENNKKRILTSTEIAQKGFSSADFIDVAPGILNKFADPPQPNLSASTSSVQQGSTVIYTATNLVPNGPIDVYRINPDGVKSPLGTRLASAQGESSITVSYTCADKQGRHYLEIQDVYRSGTKQVATDIMPSSNCAPPPDYSIAVSPSSQTVTQGQSTNYAVTVTSQNGFSGQVALSVKNLPGNIVSCTGLQPQTVSVTPNESAASVLKICTTSQSPTGTFSNLYIEGQGNGLTRNSSNFSIILNATTCSLSCTATGPTNAMINNSVSFSGSATPTNCAGTPTYSWDFGDGAVRSTQQNPTHTYTKAGTYTWRMIAEIQGAPFCNSSGTITVTDCTAPTITTQPVGKTINSGSITTLTVVATGTSPLSYQWYEGAKSDTSKPVGTNANSFTTPALTANKSYWVRVRNACGVVDSETAIISLTTPCTSPMITIQPNSQTIVSGQVATVSVIVNGTMPLSYQWFEGAKDDTSKPVGANSNQLTTTVTNVAKSFWVRVRNNCGIKDSNVGIVSPLLAVRLGEVRLVGRIDKNRPTVVLIHGLSAKSDLANAPSSLWTGEMFGQARSLLVNKPIQANILTYIWEGAFTVTDIGKDIPTRDEYVEARSQAGYAGLRLADELLQKLGADYNQEIHFIGHSLGSIVGAYGIKAYLRKALLIPKAQFTALDRPHHVNKIIWPLATAAYDGDWFQGVYGFNSDYFAGLFADLGELGKKLIVDNYYADQGDKQAGLGVGDVANPTAGIFFYNHPRLVNPNDLDDKIFPNEGPSNNHSGVHQWYRLTMDPNFRIPAEKPQCSSARFLNPSEFNNTLNPCQQGWEWSLLGAFRGQFPRRVDGAPAKFANADLPATNFSNGQKCQMQGKTISCSEGTVAFRSELNEANPAAYSKVTLEIPTSARYLTFEYRFTNMSDGDYVAMFIDGNPTWKLSSVKANDNEFINSGIIPVDGLTGQRTLTIALFADGVANAQIEIRNFQIVSVSSPPILSTVSDQSVKVGDSLKFKASATDSDGDKLTYSLVNAPAAASIDAVTGEFGWNPTLAQIGTHTFEIVVTDSSTDQLFSKQVITITVNSNLEADVAPRNFGNGGVSASDWVQIGRFVSGLDELSSGSEFQRADNAPRATFGDGRMTVADWVQAGRYAAGLDPVAAAGGAFAPVAALPPLPSTSIPREVKAISTQWQRGKINTLQIAMDAKGNENGLAFSLNYDPQVMMFLDASLADGATGASLQVNATKAANGSVGIVLVLPAGQQLVTGARNLVNVRFIPNGGDGSINTIISFSDQSVTRELVDGNAAPIGNVTYTNAAVTITGKAVATVSAANYVGGEQAAESIVSAFGGQLAAMTQPATSLPLPISLGGSQVIVKDSKGVERFAPLFYVSPTQINFQIPKDTAEGVATLTILSGTGVNSTGLLAVGKVSPALFSADATGSGFAAGSALLVRGDGSRTENNLVRYDAASGKNIANPIDLGNPSDQAYLTLYGTGIKNRSDIANVKVKIGGVDAPVEYAGAQGFFAGLDQLNVKVPRGLIGRGTVNLELSVEGKTANLTTVTFK